ncbi:MAG: sialate O-acetylesterase [Ferruginibacter sp.]
MKKIVKLLVFLLILQQASARVFLPAVYSNHMVLQQKTTVKIWGWSEVGEKITISNSWNKDTARAEGNAYAKWETTIQTPAAGGTYTITVNGQYNNIVIEDVLIGEVWLASGQSNMEMNVYWGLPYDEEVKRATNNQIRFFHIGRTSSPSQQEDVKAQWVVCSPESMKSFSAVAYFFGRQLNEKLQVPVGLIGASWGGTPAEVWTPEDVIRNDSVLKAAASKLTETKWWPVKPAYNYNAMIAPLTNFKIAGTIWYQGESNVGSPSTYNRLLTTMIKSWRKQWGDDFPFYFVQVAPYNYETTNVCALLREAQTKVLALEKTGMVVTSDLVDNINDIHPKLKKEVGERLAALALAKTYAAGNTNAEPPLYQSMKIEKNKIRIFLSNAPNGLLQKGTGTGDFYIAGADKNFVPATFKIEGNTVLVWAKEIKEPVAVRFGFSNTAMPGLFSKEGLPVNLFRTDDWEVETVPVKSK